MNAKVYVIIFIVLGFVAGYVVGERMALRSVNENLSSINRAALSIQTDAARCASNLDRIESHILTQ